MSVAVASMLRYDVKKIEANVSCASEETCFTSVLPENT